MTLTQLTAPLPCTTPLGAGIIHFVIDYGIETHLYWVVAQNDAPHAGEIWTWANPDIRIEPNVTIGRGPSTKPSA